VSKEQEEHLHREIVQAKKVIEGTQEARIKPASTGR
jgi:hypothetical protein